jgi:ribosomal protein L40E
MNNSIDALPKVRFGEWIGEGWNMFAAEWKVWVLNTLLLLMAIFVPMLGLYILFILMAAASSSSGDPAVGFAMLLLMFAGGLLVSLLSSYLAAGMYHTAFKQLRGEPISTRDMFSAERFPQVLGASILVGIFTVIGTMLCVIPGFIVAGALYFTIPLVVERRLSITEAIQASRDATRGDLFKFVLFAVVVSLIAQAGAYACYVGLLATMPLHYTIAAIAYRDCFGMPGARSFATKTSPQDAYGAPPASNYPVPASEPWPDYGQQGFTPPSAVYQQPPPPAESPLTAPQQRNTDAVQRTPTSKVQICPSCQAELPTTARFCARCGRSMT